MLDYDLSQKNRATFLYTDGTRVANPIYCDASGLPVPFTATVGNTQRYILGLIEDNYAINDDWINQLKYGVNYSGGVSTNPGESAAYAASASSLANLPTGQALRPFAQDNGWSDVWGDFGTSSYNSLQISLTHKPQHGLSYTVNYTYSKLFDNTGTGRTAYGNFAAKLISCGRLE